VSAAPMSVIAAPPLEGGPRAAAACSTSSSSRPAVVACGAAMLSCDGELWGQWWADLAHASRPVVPAGLNIEMQSCNCWFVALNLGLLQLGSNALLATPMWGKSVLLTQGTRPTTPTRTVRVAPRHWCQ
jgi:hypothetical protein